MTKKELSKQLCHDTESLSRYNSDVNIVSKQSRRESRKLRWLPLWQWQWYVLFPLLHLFLLESLCMRAIPLYDNHVIQIQAPYLSSSGASM